MYGYCAGQLGVVGGPYTGSRGMPDMVVKSASRSRLRPNAASQRARLDPSSPFVTPSESPSPSGR